MSDLIDGPVIAGPRYSYQTVVADDPTPAGSTVELGDVSGRRDPSAAADDLPTEPLYETREYHAVLKRQERLHLASRFFAAAITGRGDLCQRSPDGLRQWCWDQADRFLADHDRLTPPRVAAEPVPPTTAYPDRNDLSYLLWLSNFEAVPPSAVCPVLGPDLTAKCRRRALREGHITSTRWEGSHGYTVTDVGRQLANSRETFEVLKLGGCDESA